MTMLVGIYDENNKKLLLSNAGHEPPLIHNADGNFKNFEDAGPPLGIAQNLSLMSNRFHLKTVLCIFLLME